MSSDADLQAGKRWTEEEALRLARDLGRQVTGARWEEPLDGFYESHSLLVLTTPAGPFPIECPNDLLMDCGEGRGARNTLVALLRREILRLPLSPREPSVS